MQEGVYRELYDGPVLVKFLLNLKPHAGCYGRCGKIAQSENKETEWH